MLDAFALPHFSGVLMCIFEAFENRQFQKAVRQIMQLADLANQYIDQKKPWQMIKDETQTQAVHQVCSMGLNLFRLLILYLKPILPEMAKATEAFLNIEPMDFFKA